jgi:hypothetical protein
VPDPAIKIDFEQMIGSISKVKLRGGVVGKVCTVLIVIAVAAAIIAWVAHAVWVCVLALILLFGTSLPVLLRLLTFADKNPQAALFEGAEFLAHEQMKMGMKSTPILPESGAIIPPPDKPAVDINQSPPQLPDDPSNG